MTTLALAIGIAVAYWLQPGMINKQSLTIKDVPSFTQQADSSFDWAHFFLHNFTLQVLFIALATGVLLHYSKKRLEINRTLEKISYYVFKALRYVMICLLLAHLAAWPIRLESLACIP